MTSYLGQNLHYLRKKKGLRQAEIQNHTGFPRTTWSNWETGISEPSIENIIKVADFFGIEPGSLIFSNLENVQGTGEEDNSTISKNVQGNVQEHVQVKKKYTEKEGSQLFVVSEPVVHYKETNKMPAVISIDHAGHENIVYVPIKARAGYLTGYGDPEFMEKLPQIFDPIYRNGTYRLWEVDGNSMFPTLHDRDKALCRWDSISNAVDGRVYVIVTNNDGILIKRVINRHKEGKFICKSDNNHRGEYPPIILDVQHIAEVWYVVEARSKQLSEPGEIYKRTVNLEGDMILMKQELEKMKQMLLKP